MSPAPPASAPPTTGVLQERRHRPGLLLALLGHVAMRRLRDTHIAQGLTPRQFGVLALLHDQGAMAQAELGAQTGIDASILVTMLNPLEVDGWIRRERDPADRRRHVVELTPAGQRRLIGAARAQEEAEDSLFAGFAPGQREQLRQLLITLEQSLAPGGAACPLDPEAGAGRSCLTAPDRETDRP
jgi:DNA-binding MarR family transcriptional regulator